MYSKSMKAGRQSGLFRESWTVERSWTIFKIIELENGAVTCSKEDKLTQDLLDARAKAKMEREQTSRDREFNGAQMTQAGASWGWEGAGSASGAMVWD